MLIILLAILFFWDLFIVPTFVGLDSGVPYMLVCLFPLVTYYIGLFIGSSVDKE